MAAAPPLALKLQQAWTAQEARPLQGTGLLCLKNGLRRIPCECPTRAVFVLAARCAPFYCCGVVVVEVEDELELKLDELLLFDMLVADWPPAPG